MPSDTPRDDPKAIWQAQSTEGSQMTLAVLQLKARELQRKTRRELWGNMAIFVIVLLIAGRGIIQAHDLPSRLLFAFALVWAGSGQYALRRGMESLTGPIQAGARTSLESYRSELDKRSKLFGRVLQWSFGPVVLSLCVAGLQLLRIAQTNRVPLTALAPVSVLFVAWVIAVFVLRWKEHRELNRQIRELNEIEGERARHADGLV
jgi:hypothetical protein